VTKSYSICATVLTLFVPAPALAPTLGRSRLSPHPGDPRFSGQHHSSTSPNRTKRTSVTELPQIPGRYSADHALAAQIPLPALRHWRSRYAHPLPSTRRRSSPVLPLKPRASLQAMHADLDELLRHATWPRHWSTGQYATPGRQSRAIHRHLPHHWAARAFAAQGGGSSGDGTREMHARFTGLDRQRRSRKPRREANARRAHGLVSSAPSSPAA